MEDVVYRKNTYNTRNEAILAAVLSISEKTMAGAVQKLQR
jgi:hypothetical protein